MALQDNDNLIVSRESGNYKMPASQLKEYASYRTTIGDEPPIGLLDSGKLWWNSADGRLYVRYDDGDSSQWVEASPPTSIDYSLVWGRTEGALVKAFVNFDATNGLIRRAYNISSVFQSGVGKWGVNFTTPMPSNDYIAITQAGTGNDNFRWAGGPLAIPTTTSFIFGLGNSASLQNLNYVYCAFFY